MNEYLEKNVRKRRSCLLNVDGFTLLELVIVIMIIAIMATVAVLSFIHIMDNTRKSADLTNTNHIVTTIVYTLSENSEFANLTGEWSINDTSITALNSSSTDFATELQSNLTQGELVPRYVAITSPTADRFLIEITGTNQQITIYASNGTDQVEIYPDTNSGYEAK